MLLLLLLLLSTFVEGNNTDLWSYPANFFRRYWFQGEPVWSSEDGQVFKASLEWDTWYHGFPKKPTVNVDPRRTDTLPLVDITKYEVGKPSQRARDRERARARN